MTTLRTFRIPRSLTSSTAVRLVAVLLLITISASCSREPEAPPEIYRVRGLVRQLPAPNKTHGDVLVKHEAIPSFKDADGNIVGMETMSMPFPLADIALLTGVEVGDKVDMEFEVNWHGGNPLRVTAIEKLPEGTSLAFEDAEPVPAEPGDEETADPPPEPATP